jgi:hypothetical protein
MDAKEFVREVVVPNCEEFKVDPSASVYQRDCAALPFAPNFPTTNSGD